MTKLTERETQVLRLIADGHGNRGIGKVLYLSEDTIKTHACRLFRKLNATGRAHAVNRGYETGILRVDTPAEPTQPVAVVVQPPTQRWVTATMEKVKSEALRQYRERRHEFTQTPGATKAGSRALWRLADLYPQQFRALVADELARAAPRLDAA